MISALFLTEKVPPHVRASQSPIKYAPFLAASGVARREHLEKDPVVANELEAQMRLQKSGDQRCPAAHEARYGAPDKSFSR
jgi:hypothetical protein